MKPTHIITTALHYANGELHLGHMLEAAQADIYVRFLKQKGERPLFICGSDMHGTPIMLASKAKNITPEQMTQAYHKQHKQTFANYSIDYDNFHHTSSEENRQLTIEIFTKLEHNQKIFSKDVAQAFDEVEEMFLPDRYIKGSCPKCLAPDQYGDSCEKCGAFYEPLTMNNPKSILSNSEPIKKTSKHVFFDLPKCNINDFLSKCDLEQPVRNKLTEWLKDGLQPWDISRDQPYHGFPIPGYPNKYFYVWLDAPVGYIASCKNIDNSLTELWQQESSCNIIHFIGKDIMYFHGLFWPAVLAAAGLKQPDKIVVHGFLSINGQKMSKSRGSMINADTFIEQFEPDQFKYFIASKTNNSTTDIDLNLSEFIQKINTDLIGKYLNIASRTAKFINNDFEDLLIEFDCDNSLHQIVKQKSKLVLQHYDKLDFSKVCKEIMHIADLINKTIAEQAPWKMPKDQKCHEFCSLIFATFIDLSILLKPIIPNLVGKVEQLLNLPALTHKDLHQIRNNHRINKYYKLMARIPSEAVNL